jgi:glycosyl transferase family 2
MTTRRRPTISVVICCYDAARVEAVLAAIASARAQTLPPAEIAVVVDHNPSLLRRVRREAPDVIAIANKQAKGLSGARNTGVAATRSDVVAFLDDDAVAEPDWLEQLAAPYLEPGVAGVGGTIVPDWTSGRPPWFPREFDWVVGCTYVGMPTERARVRNVIGANMSFRRDVLAAAGGFAVEMGRIGSYPLGNDDTEFCLRAHRTLPDQALVFEPRARVLHTVPPVRSSWRYFRTRCYAEGRAKASLTAVAGRSEGLSSERSYALHVLPRGFARGVRAALAGDRAGLTQALAIVAGLAITAGGYVRGVLRPYAHAGGAARPTAAPSHATLRAVVPLAPLLTALALWSASLAQTDLGRIGDFGLLPALPWTFYAALAVLATGFTRALRAELLHERLVAAYVAALILIVHATPSIEYGTLRYAWAWKHVGIVDYIQRHGRVDPDIQFLGAYHNWPGFFALSSLYTQLAGYSSALSFASWAPLFFNLLYLGALVMLFGALTTDRRRVWLAAWFFVAGSWVGQDYFSPQAYAYFLFLVVIAVCVSWFRLSRIPHPRAIEQVVRSTRAAAWLERTFRNADRAARWHGDAGSLERLVLAVAVLSLIAVIASSHQLTPFMLVLALAGLVILQRIELRTLPLFAAVISIAWVAFFSVGFLRGNLYWVVDSVGAFSSNANSTLINLAAASHGQRVVANVDRLLTLGVWVLGGLGFMRLLRRRQLDLTAGVLAVAPFGMLGATSYGGEILFRVYFFSLPFFALLAAALFYPTASSTTSRLAGVALTGVSMALIAGLLVGYYGKEAQNYFSHGEVRAAGVLYANAPAGSLLVSGVNDYPWAFERYEEFSYLALADLTPVDRRRAIARPAETIAALARHSKAPCAYVVLTSSERAAVDMSGVMPPGSLVRVQRRLEEAPGFRVVFRNPSATIFELPLSRSTRRCDLA